MSKFTIVKFVAPLAGVALMVGVGARMMQGPGGIPATPAQNVSPDRTPIRLIDDNTRKAADLKKDDLVGTWACHGEVASGPLKIVFDGISILKPDDTSVGTATALIQIGEPINKNLRIVIETRGAWKVDGGILNNTTDAYSAHGFNDSDDAIIKGDPRFGQFLAKPPEKSPTVDTISDFTGGTFTLSSTDPNKPNDPPSVVMHYTRITK